MIDKIYIINLEESIERKKKVKKQLDKLNIKNYIFFKAIRPTENCLKKYPHLDKQELPIDTKIRRLGCILSHVNVMKDALNNNYKNIIIFEDDINILDINFFK